MARASRPRATRSPPQRSRVPQRRTTPPDVGSESIEVNDGAHPAIHGGRHWQLRCQLPRYRRPSMAAATSAPASAYRLVSHREPTRRRPWRVAGGAAAGEAGAFATDGASRLLNPGTSVLRGIGPARGWERASRARATSRPRFSVNAARKPESQAEGARDAILPHGGPCSAAGAAIVSVTPPPYDRSHDHDLQTDWRRLRRG